MQARKQFGWMGRSVVLGCVILAAAGILRAQDHDLRKPAFIYWPSGDRVISVVQGQVYEYEAGFRSIVPLANVHWTASRELVSFFGSNPEFVTGAVDPEQTYTIRRTFQVPMDLAPGTYVGNLVILGARTGGPKGAAKDSGGPTPLATFLRLTVEVLPAP